MVTHYLCQKVSLERNTRDQIMSERRSKCAGLKCVLCIPFILSTKSMHNPFVIHPFEQLYPTWDTLQHMIEAWWKLVARQKTGKTLPVFFFINEHNNTNVKPQARKSNDFESYPEEKQQLNITSGGKRCR